jgi:hypothetical protein
VGARFYVYTLSDPRSGDVFYVGKGSRLRAWQHTSDVLKGRPVINARKTAAIADILSAGHQPAVAIVAKYDIEADAFDHEAELIAVLPGLTNMLARGGGWALTPDEAARRAEARAERIALQKRVKTRQWLADWLRQAETWGEVTFPGMVDGDRKAREYMAMVRQIVSEPIGAA